jgi:hypothetical protein
VKALSLDINTDLKMPLILVCKLINFKNLTRTLFFLILNFSLVGCAKFGYLVGASVTAFQIQTPIAGTALVPSTTFTITGVCDPLGGLVTITGTSMAEASVNGACDPTFGTFSINATSLATGELLDLQASQTDAQGTLLNSTINSLMIHCAGAAMRACALSGSGNPSDQYIVGNISCLQEMRTGLSCHYALNNNIDASATSTWNASGPDFLGWNPVPDNNNLAITFTGSLDGRGHTISNLYMAPRFNTGVGLFSRLEGTGAVPEHVYDLTLSNPSMDLYRMDSPFGFVAGLSNNANIRNVDVVNGNANLETNANRELIGFLIGEATSNNIADSQTSGLFQFNGSFDEVNTKYGYVGGFVGRLVTSAVTNSVSNVNMATNPANLSYFAGVGGAFGEIDGSSVNGFRTAANLELDHSGVNSFSSVGIANAGGFAGRIISNSTINNICVNSNLDLRTINMGIEVAGGFAGYVGLAGTVNADTISVRGFVLVEPTNNFVDAISGFVGVDFGVTNYSNIMMDSDIQILSGTSPVAFRGYGGILSNNGGSNSVSFTNLIATSSHSIPPGVNTPGGLFYNTNSAVLSSLFYANDPSLGGLPAEGSAGPSAGITTSTLAALSAQPNASYTGFDFVSIWQRDGVTNRPELRYCP